LGFSGGVFRLLIIIKSQLEWVSFLTGGGGHQSLLYARGATKADHTMMSFWVDDIYQTVR